MLAKDTDGAEPTQGLERREEVEQPGGFAIDLPQYVPEEVRAPAARPLQPVADRTPVHRGGLRGLLGDWRVKAAVQKLLGSVPGGNYLHLQLQRRVGGLRDFAKECDAKVGDWHLMMGHLATARVSLPQVTLLETGTGWYPTFPVCLYLAGARQVTSVDIQCLLDPAMTVAMVERLAEHLPLIARVAKRDETEVRVRYAALLHALRGGATVAAATNGAITFCAPGDASRTGLMPSSVDVVFSNSVLEHVPADVLDACFAEAMRVLQPGGIIFHSVNCGDHYAYTDRSINQLHYLQFSDADWRKWNNAFLYQNRLRAKDFTTKAERAGFRIELDTSRPHPDRLEQLDALDVHPQFATKYPREQLAITSIDFIGRKPADEPGN